ncbi:MAG TPA: EscU/YscU/HrcU family type III secretion system export apparatus switch protein [Candidatus Eremiobacteraceae bacterium]|nr:EscU/YscU/HrcU family type III secretion system export apparatus switch protein [Candidatus Eremiobacteraceae bacterium]
MSDGHERSEPATPKRRERARREGDRPRSTLAPSALAISCAIIPALYGTGFASSWIAAFAAAADLAAEAGARRIAPVQTFVVATTPAEWIVCLLACLGSTLAAVGSGAASGALGWSPGSIGPKSWSRAFRLRPPIDFETFMQTLVSAIAAVAVVVAALPAVADVVEHVGGSSWRSTTMVLSDALYGLWWRVSAALCVIAVAEVAIARRRHATRLRMTLREVRDERTEQEGKPETRSRRRGIAIRRAKRIRLEALRRASAVIANPTHVAVALRYDPPGIDVPVVVAAGAGLAATFVRTIAAYHEIPVIESPELARAVFARVDIDEPVPEEFYAAIAAIFAWLMRTRGRLGGNPDR